MGLLDQVLGQVLGGGQPQRTGAPPSRGPAAPQLPGGMQASPLVLAILALVASKVIPQGAGGLGSILRDMVGGGRGSEPRDDMREGDVEMPTSGPSDRGFGGGERQQRSGGFLDQVGGMLDHPNRPGGAPHRSEPHGDMGSLGGGLGGGLVGGGLGGLLGSGLGGLLERFSQNGRGDVMESWIGSGPNREVSPDDLDGALGPETVDELSRGTGLDRDDLLSQLSETLPQVVDGLTPDGRLPHAEEESRWV